jgi:hypothetical protein
MRINKTFCDKCGIYVSEDKTYTLALDMIWCTDEDKPEIDFRKDLCQLCATNMFPDVEKLFNRDA